MDREPTPLGKILEAARDALQISIREAARRASITEARWRQVVIGVQRRRDKMVPAKPRPITVVAMALAVDVDPVEALQAAGLNADQETVLRLVAAVRRATEPADGQDALTAEIERIRGLPGISAPNKLKMIAALLDVWEQDDGGERKAAG